ncbi:MAG: hypothetical protein J6J60_05380 [Clostridia bacterium]|nr:hypothetical protein [Clostridia bacterium]
MKKVRMIFKGLLYFIMILIIFINFILISQWIFNPNEVPNILGYKPYIVMDDSNQTDMKFGEFVLVKKDDNISKNDIVLVKKEFITATSYNVEENKNGMLKLENDTKDFVYLSENSIEGKVIFKITFLGEMVLFLQNPIVIVFLIFISILLGICIYRINL